MNTAAEAPAKSMHASRSNRPNAPAAAKPPLPREHGAWGILLVPLATAAGIAGVFDAKIVLLTASVICFFVTRMSFQKRHWNWVAILLAASAATALPLVLVWHRWWLVAFAAASAPLAFRKTERNLAAQLIAMLGLTATAPAAWYVATGKFDAWAWKLWLLNSLYFASGFFFVKMHIAAAIRRQHFVALAEKIRFATANVAFHVGAVCLLTLLVVTGVIAWPCAVIFAPMVVRGLVGTARLTPTLRIKRLAWLEVTYSVVFGVSLILVGRMFR